MHESLDQVMQEDHQSDNRRPDRSDQNRAAGDVKNVAEVFIVLPVDRPVQLPES